MQRLNHGSMQYSWDGCPYMYYLIDRRAGTGQAVAGEFGQAGYKERVDFGSIIGDFIDPVSGEVLKTTKGIIHYSKKGAHIVPARP